jgi:glycosyltransferase involved in cell wall biosynthesis
MTAAAPEVSVVLPTHNRPRLLALTLFSVLWQEGVDVEVVVVDDGSTDDIGAVVKELADARVRLIRHERPRGVSAARNRGVAEARASWIAFLDDDDVWAPDKLLAQLQAARDGDHGWAYVGAVNVTEDLRILGGAPPAPADEVVTHLHRANLIPGGCSGVVVHRDLLPPQPFDSSYRHFADWDLWIRLTSLGRPAGVARPLVGYRIHHGNASLDTSGMVAELDVIEQRYGGPVDRARFYRHVARVSQRASRRGAAVRYYLQAAARDREYRRRGLTADLAEIAQGVRRQLRRRLAGAPVGDMGQASTVGPGHHDADQGAWIAAARPWLEVLAAKWSAGTGCESHDFRET